MYVSVNKYNEIKEVGISTDVNLTSIYIDENEEHYPFKGWSEAKICCYKVEVKDGVVMLLAPYIDVKLLDHFDQLGKASETNANDISDTMDGLTETFEAVGNNTDDISVCMDALAEIYEMIGEM